jgi:putative alpha-1,2-mannosidase
VPRDTYDVTSYPYTDGGSETLEYSVDDFAIAQLARAAGRAGEAAVYAARARTGRTCPIRPRATWRPARPTGASRPGPAYQPSSPALLAQGVAQPGFEEGNAVQYSWMVPQDMAGLFGLMGGDRAAAAKLDTFFTHLNATRFAPYDWAGNEPTMSVPYDYDYIGRP